MNVSRKNPLHLSTLLIVAGTAFALLLIVIPGEIILLAVGFLVEHRRRKRNSFWQVSLPELLGIFVAVAVIVTLVTESFQQIQREAKARQLLVEPQACSFEFVDAAPAWLRKLTDNSRFLQVRVSGTEPVPLGWRVREVQFADQGLGWFKNPAECAKCFAYEISTWVRYVSISRCYQRWSRYVLMRTA